jgi:hypothetical protein
VRDGGITSVVRDGGITSVVRDGGITSVVRDGGITSVVRGLQSSQPRLCLLKLRLNETLLLLLNMLMPAQLNSFTHLRAQLVIHGRGGEHCGNIEGKLWEH